MPDASAKLPSSDDDAGTLTSTVIVDSRLECPRCQYNLTGLLGDRCPECGTVIDWAALRGGEIDDDRPGTHWERSRGWWLPVGFVQTVLRAAFLPWLFAKELPARPSLTPPVLFGMLCFGGWLAVATNASSEGHGNLPAWALGVLCCLVLETLLFGLALPVGRARHSLRFWLAVGLYTSYPLLIEGLARPPYVVGTVSDIWPLSLLSGETSMLATTMVYLWWAWLVVIAAVRLPRARRRRAYLVLVEVPLFVCVSSYAGFAVSVPRLMS